MAPKAGKYSRYETSHGGTPFGSQVADETISNSDLTQQDRDHEAYK